MPVDQPFDLEPIQPEPEPPRKPGLPAQSAAHNPVYETPAAPATPAPLEDEFEPPAREPVPVGRPVQQAAPASPQPRIPSPTPTTGADYSVTDLDVCPSCGAPMRGADALVCTRCGFDLKTMKKVRTVTGVTEVSAPTEIAGGEDVVPVISKPGRGDQWLPLGIAGLCAAILLIAYLAGVPGLFPGRAVTDITFGVRIEGLLRFIVMTAMWACCGAAGLLIVAQLQGMKIGDWTLLAMRVLSIASVMQLIRLLGFSIPWIEHAVEIILQLGAFAGLSLALFEIKPKDLPMLVGSAVALFLALWMGSAAVVWATTGS